jgi:hypothetical protein
MLHGQVFSMRQVIQWEISVVINGKLLNDVRIAGLIL